MSLPDPPPADYDPDACPDCQGTGQVLTAQVVRRRLRRRTIQSYALCLTCCGTT
ncbi:hypothetical protein [Sphaerisporangium perillae]|uniref:hypothetical protein n=1 Tax=Sphaerisporangium perillae TaxID=2935860 RepID=UPI00200CBA20|nr:hypothetical protein [Sphaerisporangium perillae]